MFAINESFVNKFSELYTNWMFCFTVVIIFINIQIGTINSVVYGFMIGICTFENH